MRRESIIFLLLTGITLALYWPAGGYDQVYFDDTFFTENAAVQSGLNWHSLVWALTDAPAANWHPVTSLSFVVTHQLFGQNPGAEHLVNAGIHALNAGLLFLVLLGLTRRSLPVGKAEPTRAIALPEPKDGGTNTSPRPSPHRLRRLRRRGEGETLATSSHWNAPGGSGVQSADANTDAIWLCAVVAGLFAWHPLRVESVAWIAERKDVLCALFMLLTFWAYGRHVAAAEGAKLPPKKGKRKAEGGNNQPSTPNVQHPEVAGSVKSKAWRFYWLAVVFFALGLMSKAMVVTLPFLLLLLDIWPLKRLQNSVFRIQNWKRLMLEKLPFFLLTLVFCIITFQVQKGGNATPSLAELGPGLRLENIIVSYARYLDWTLWPVNLAVYYSFPYDSHFYLALWPMWQIVGAGLLLALVSVLCVLQLGRRPYLAVGWFWYLGTLIPVIGLVQVGGQGMADRYTYIPLIGPVISVVWLVAEYWGKRVYLKAVIGAAAAAALGACLLQTHHQLQFWKDSDTLFQHTIEVTGENPKAEYILGLGLEHQGRLNEAILHYRNAISSQPRVTEAFYALGRLFAQQGKWAEAAATYSARLGDNPNDFTAHLGLATALPHLGRLNEAKDQLEAAIQDCPDTADAMNNLAWTLATSSEAALRDANRAVELGEKACAMTGYQETIMVGTLAAAYAEAGRFDEAIATAQKACALASRRGQIQLLAINQQLLELYRQHQPYRETGNPEKPESSTPAPAT